MDRDLNVCKKCGKGITLGSYCAECFLKGLKGEFKFNWYSGKRGQHGNIVTRLQ